MPRTAGVSRYRPTAKICYLGRGVSAAVMTRVRDRLAGVASLRSPMELRETTRRVVDSPVDLTVIADCTGITVVSRRETYVRISLKLRYHVTLRKRSVTSGR